MALHPHFPESPHAVLEPAIRWFPADEALRECSMDKLMPPLVAELRKRVKRFRDSGSGKTKVLSLALARSFFHKLYEPESQLARNFLVVAPNIIVPDRIYKDFQGLRIFFADPVIPEDGVDGRS